MFIMAGDTTLSRMLLLALAFVRPTLGRPSPLATQDECSLSPDELKPLKPCGPGSIPIVYIPRYADACPPAYKMDDAGICANEEGHDGGLGSKHGKCTPRYCEVRQTFRFHREMPYPISDCHWPATCTLTVHQGVPFDLGSQADRRWHRALDQGVSGGYSEKPVLTPSGFSHSVTPEPHECGYLTFLPLTHESCGTMSQGFWHKSGFWPGHAECKDYESIGNFCTTQPHRNQKETSVIGTVVFVKVDCGNRARLPMDQQPIPYQNPGVALPHEYYSQVKGGAQTNSTQGTPLISMHRVNVSDIVNHKVVVEKEKAKALRHHTSQTQQVLLKGSSLEL